MRAGDDERFRMPRKPRRGLFRRRAGEVRSGDVDVKGMKEFAASRAGVEAYVEPRTMQQPMSVVLVAHDGEWLRFTVPDERSVQGLGVPIYEAARVGYPKRMKEYRRDRPPGSEPTPPSGPGLDDLPPLD
ncbi:MAG TPA: oxidoreductase [Actinomycetota bacterium]|jgi:hypothetical protein